MNDSLSGVATYIVAGLTGIVAVTGAVVTITNPETLSFKDYVDSLQGFALAGGVLAVGRGILGAAKRR